MSTVSDYTGLVTSEHKDKPLYMAILGVLMQHTVDLQATLLSMPALFDLDTAVQSQLDILGNWVGFGRTVFVPGFSTVTLGDSDYRTLLRAKILANHWDGTYDTLQVILTKLFPGTGVTLIAVDNQDMSMDIYVTGGTLTALQLALIKGGYLVPKPEGVRINGVVQLTGPLFGLDYADSTVNGLDIGAFITYL